MRGRVRWEATDVPGTRDGKGDGPSLFAGACREGEDAGSPLGPKLAPTLVLFTRVPRAGRCKTRLLTALSGGQAAWLQRAMLGDLVARVATLGWPLVVSYEPDGADSGELASFTRGMPARARLEPQAGYGLGERMRRATDGVLARGGGPVLLMGSDLPLVTADVLHEAWAGFEDAGADVLVCPSRDGGYWLVGLREPFPAFFDCRGYGGSDVLRGELAICAAHGREVALGPVARDVDGPADLAWLVGLALGGDPRVGPGVAACVRALAAAGALDGLAG